MEERCLVEMDRPLYLELQEVATKRGITTKELLHKFMKLGLLAVYIEDEANATIIIRGDDGSERELLLLGE